MPNRHANEHGLQVVSPLHDDKVAWSYLVNECGRAENEIFVLCACADLGIDLANAVKELLQRDWLLGAHGPIAKAERRAARPVKNIKSLWPEDVKPLAICGKKIIDVVEKADALVRAVKELAPILGA